MLDLKNVCIDSTMEYDRFTNITGNRVILTDSVKKLMASVSEKHLASIAIVNEKDEIIDGAHRYKVAKELGVPFNFIMMEGYGIEEVHMLNSNMKNWTNVDFVHQFYERYLSGEKIFINYYRLSQFIDEHELKLNQALLLLECGVKSGSIPLRNGTFKIYEDKSVAEENLTELIALENEIDAAHSQAFWQSYILAKQVEGFDKNRFFTKMSRAKSDINDTKDSFKNLISAFEDIYNRGKSADLNIAFVAKQIEKKIKKDKDIDAEHINDEYIYGE